MKQYSSDKHNVAWFMLSECVTRGEKERAMGVYKLLAHSLEDKAFSRQLEGDLLWAFEDESAHTRYLEAAALYKKNQRFVEAAAVYEHLIVLQPESEDHVLSLLSLYQILNFSEKLTDCLKAAVERYAHHADSKKLNNFIAKLEETNRDGAIRARQFIVGK